MYPIDAIKVRINPLGVFGGDVRVFPAFDRHIDTDATSQSDPFRSL